MASEQATIINLFGEVDTESALDARFEQFWRAYPIRIGKATARKAFERKLNRITFDALMAAVVRFAEHPESIPGKHDSIPHASTWLNQERFFEVPEPVQAAMERHPSFARIPQVVESCDKCDHGFIELGDGSVRRCDHAS